MPSSFPATHRQFPHLTFSPSSFAFRTHSLPYIFVILTLALHIDIHWPNKLSTLCYINISNISYLYWFCNTPYIDYAYLVYYRQYKVLTVTFNLFQPTDNNIRLLKLYIGISHTQKRIYKNRKIMKLISM